jgi:MFS family permease
MSVTTSGSGAPAKRKSVWEGLWNRQLEHYPNTWPRMMYLGMTVLATVMLYYELYVIGSVSTFVLADLHIGFTFFVYATAFGNLIGAFGSLFAGLTDRLGRTNLVVIGLIITGIFTLLIIPQATSKWELFIFLWIVGFVEGICLVATPALIRDFSPQTGRATALGFWTSAPVLGSLIVAVVASNTIPATATPSSWTHQFHICGVAGVVVAVMAIFILKELSPGLRDQLMVSMHDRALIEARAKGLDIEHLLHHPWRQLMKTDVIVSAIGISVFLVVYYTAVGFAVIFFTTIYGFTVKDANGLGNWNWGFNVISVIMFGFISDAFRVRKPFMIIGGVAAGIMTVIWLSQIGHHPGYYKLAIIVAILSFMLGVAYVPWMASFTETVEAHNPALTATGLAIWGWIIRVIVFITFLILPAVINTVTPLVNYGAGVQTAAAQYPTELAAVAAHPTVFAQLAANPSAANIAAATAAVGPQTLAKIVAANNAPGNAALYGKGPNGKPLNGFQYALAHGAKVQKAAKDSPGQWKTWYWICFGCIIFFLLTVPLMRGRWSPRKARQDEEDHDRMVEEELARLHVAG